MNANNLLCRNVARKANYSMLTKQPLHVGNIHFTARASCSTLTSNLQNQRRTMNSPDRWSSSSILSHHRHPSGCLCCEKRPELSSSSGWSHSSSSPIRLPQRQFSANHTEEDSKTDEIPVVSSQDGSVVAADPDNNNLGIPGAQKGGKKLAIVFTCTVCDTRSAKQFTENAYENGVVIVQCPGCDSRHLIADNLGYFSEAGGNDWNIETAMAEIGENVTMVNNDNVMELSVDQVFGEDMIKNAMSSSDERKKDDDKSSSS